MAFAPLWHLVLAFVVGKRTHASADLLLERVMHVTDDHIPFFTSDQLSEYRDAVLNTYGIWYQRQRQGDRGRYPKPLRIPPPDLLYAQVVKVREHGRVVLRQRLTTLEPTRGTGSQRRWQLLTPAMAAGLTDHILDDNRIAVLSSSTSLPGWVA